MLPAQHAVGPEAGGDFGRQLENRAVLLLQAILHDGAGGDVGDDAADHQGSKGPDGIVLQDHFEGEEHPADGGVKDGAYAGGRPAADQDGHAVAGDAEKPADSGGDGGTHLHDGALSAGRPAGADGSAGGDDFLDRD